MYHIKILRPRGQDTWGRGQCFTRLRPRPRPKPMRPRPRPQNLASRPAWPRGLYIPGNRDSKRSLVCLSVCLSACPELGYTHTMYCHTWVTESCSNRDGNGRNVDCFSGINGNEIEVSEFQWPGMKSWKSCEWDGMVGPYQTFFPYLLRTIMTKEGGLGGRGSQNTPCSDGLCGLAT